MQSLEGLAMLYKKRNQCVRCLYSDQDTELIGWKKQMTACVSMHANREALVPSRRN